MDRLAERQMTQAELARRIGGMNRRLLNQCIKGWRHLPAHWREKIAHELEIRGDAYNEYKLAALEHPLRQYDIAKPVHKSNAL